ncbi:hypothetical protein [Methylobacterium sp. Leaf100]|uniref:hypothetical protein n=1 Tax=Methylobacterium sp. Leaf100 TaxID=1736252 RepID=UPI0006F3D2A6|nr:hypothetical protein [Methylobacterium sp. Leaf100]KQP27492.1 hypothetical protein ASF25_20775 [Methylobacterium sp. Leaf100]
MTPMDFAGLLKEYGGWGLSAILMAALVKVYKDKDALVSSHIERFIIAIEASKNSADGVKGALQELRSLIDTSGKAVGDHSHQIAILVEKVIHGFGNTTAALEGIARRLERSPDRSDRERT